MNQSILFNDDLAFNTDKACWHMSGMVAGQLVTIYFHSYSLSKLDEISNCTRYDLEEIAEMWFEDNELESNEIHIKLS